MNQIIFPRLVEIKIHMDKLMHITNLIHIENQWATLIISLYKLVVNVDENELNYKMNGNCESNKHRKCNKCCKLVKNVVNFVEFHE